MKSNGLIGEVANRTDLAEAGIDVQLQTRYGTTDFPGVMPKEGSDQSLDDSSSIAFIDRRTLTRECIARCLATTLKNVTISIFDSVAACREASCGGNTVDLILYNAGCRHPAEASVDGDVAALMQYFSDTPVVLISDTDTLNAIGEALRRGVRGYIPTTVNFKLAVEAIRLVRFGGVFVPSNVLVSSSKVPSSNGCTFPRSLPQRGLENILTLRQLSVLACLRQGMANKTIAFELKLSENTVNVHIRNIMRKLRATNRTQVVCLTNGTFEELDRM